MITIQNILAHKGSQVWSVSRNATVLEAAMLMSHHRIGALVVIEGANVVGIFTERDVLQKIVAQKRDPANTLVEEVMTDQVVCCTLETTLDEARGALKNRHIRHLPVMDGAGQLVGVVSIGDMNAHLATDQERTIYLLQEYLFGRM